MISSFAPTIGVWLLQWARTTSRFPLFADDDPIKAWFERCLDLEEGPRRPPPGY